MFGYIKSRLAEMAELADAHGSGPCGSNTMRVQVPFSALKANLGTAKCCALFALKIVSVITDCNSKFCLLRNGVNGSMMTWLS